jgi:hypothetical protein
MTAEVKGWPLVVVMIVGMDVKSEGEASVEKKTVREFKQMQPKK